MRHDKYTHFYFNNLSSKKFKIAVTNNHDLKINLLPSFEDSFTTPLYSNAQYYEGSTIKKQNFTLNCVAYNITKQEWRAIGQWLSPHTVGPLSFPWNERHYYMAKITQAPSGEMWIKNKVDNILEETYNITFQISFTTVGDWAAFSQPVMLDYDFDDIKNSDNFNNPYLVPFVKCIESPELTTGIWYNNLGWVSFDSDADAKLDVLYHKEETLKITIKGRQVQINSQDSISYKDYYYLYFGPDSFVKFTDIAGVSIMDESKANKLYITNPGSFEMFPNIYVNANKFNLAKDGKVIVNYESGDTSKHFVSLIGKQGFLINKGRFIQENGISFNMATLESNVFSIESGKPEILKVIYDAQGYDSECKEYYYSFKTTKKLANFRNKGYVMSIFKNEASDANVYGLDDYNDKKYSLDTRKVLYGYNIRFTEVDGYIHIYLNMSGITDMELEFKENNYYYISLCDYEEVSVSWDDMEQFSLEFQTRDVI